MNYILMPRLIEPESPTVLKYTFRDNNETRIRPALLAWLLAQKLLHCLVDVPACPRHMT